MSVQIDENRDLLKERKQRGLSHLTKTVVEGKSFDSELLHSLQLLFIEVFQLIPANTQMSKSDKGYTILYIVGGK